MTISSVAPAVPVGRLARRKARTHEALLEAATRVLAEKGLHATKIVDIAAAADVGVGTFYLHFPTKEALFAQLVSDTVARLEATCDAAQRGPGTPIERMRAANLAFCRFAAANREVFRIVFGHAGYDDVVRDAQAHFAATIAETLRDGVAAGDVASIDVAIAAQAVVGMVTQVLVWWLDHESVSVEALHDALMRLALDGLKGESDVRRR